MKRLLLGFLFFILLFNIGVTSNKIAYPRAKSVRLVVGFTSDCDYICDGASDYVQIQLACDRLATLGVAGIVKLREGVFACDNGSGHNIETKISSTTIMGSGNGTILNHVGTMPLIDLDHDNCKLTNLQIYSDGTPTSDCIDINDLNCEVSNCYINLLGDNWGSAPIGISNAANSKFIDNIVLVPNETDIEAISINGTSDDVMVRGNTIVAGFEGIDISDGDDIQISNNRIISATGIELSNANATRTMIAGNDFQGCTAAVTDTASTTPRIRNNKTTDGTWLPESDDIDLGGNNITNGGTSSIDGTGIYNVGLATDTISVLAGRAGENLVAGQAVYQSGVFGSNLEFSLADHSSLTHDIAEAVGICSLTASNNQPTLVITQGRLEGIKTNYSGWANNDELFLGLDGALTDIKPSSGTIQFIGYVGRVHTSAGSIVVQVQHPIYIITSPNGENITIRAGDEASTWFEDGQSNQLMSVNKSSVEVRIPVTIDDVLTVTDNVDIDDFLRRIGDPNTYLRFQAADNAKIAAGGLNGLELDENTVDTIFLGDDDWDYIVIGDTTTPTVDVSTFNYSTKVWSFPGKVEAKGDVVAANYSSPGNIEITGTIDTNGTPTEVYAMNQDVQTSDDVEYNSVETSTIVAIDGDGVWFRTDGGTGGFNLHDDGSMDAKGSWNMEGHDVNGADDIAGASLSITGAYSIGGADGNDGDVLTTDGAGGVTFEAPAGGGSGKAVMWFLPGSAKLPNSNFPGLEKVTRTNGVDNVLKFVSSSTATDEHAYYQTAIPDFYGGDDLTITIYSVLRTAEGADKVAEVNIEARTVAHDGAWDVAYTAIITIDVEPTGVAEDMLIYSGAWDVDGTLQLVAGQPLSLDIWVDCSDSTFYLGDSELEIICIKIEED